LPRIDLHTHSNISDGSLTPRQLVKYALECEISAIALADHDTVGGIVEFLAAGDELGVETIPAVEISVNHEDGSMHLLGYYINHLNTDLLNALKLMEEARDERNEKIVTRLNELGYPLKLEEVLSLSENGTCGRSHIARALVVRGNFNSVTDAFRALLRNGGPAYIDRFRLPLDKAIDLIYAADGVAVWAHPGLSGDRMESMLERLRKWSKIGLDGIESDYCNHSLALRDRLRRIAGENGMIYTGGSDFHGAIKLENALGCGPEGAEIDPACLVMLKQRRDRIRNLN